MKPRRPRRRRRIARSRSLETLESRRLLAGDLQNSFNRLDVNDDWIVTPADALLVINDLNAHGPRVLPLPISPPHFLNTSGDQIISPLDVLLVINAINLDTAPPTIAADVIDDTAPGGTQNDDLITSLPSVAGLVGDLSGITTLTVQVNGEAPIGLSPGDYDQTGNFTFDPDLDLDGSADGPHRLDFRAVDARSNASTSKLEFTLDTQAPQVTAQLSSDTAAGGSTNSDLITSNPTVKGSILESTSSIGQFTLAIDGGAPLDLGLSTGAFEVADQLATDGTDDGLHSFFFQSEDVAGNASAQQLDFTLDTVPPQLQAALVHDTAAGGLTNDDGVTSDPRLGGSVSDLTSGITSLQARVDSGAWLDVPHTAGQFSFNPNLALDGSDDGPHLVEFQAIDVAGNTQQHELNIVLDTQAPLVAAGLTTDTAAGGTSNDDSITSDPTVTGSIVESTSLIAQFTLAIDSGTPIDLGSSGGAFEVADQLALDGTDDGLHSFNFQFEDLAGNASALQLDFTLDTQTPQLQAGLVQDTAAGGLTDEDRVTSDPRLSGTVSDLTSGITALQARVDSGDWLDIPHNAGQFAFDPNLALDGSDDGPHRVEFLAIDVAGNEQQNELNIVLDTQTPHVTAQLQRDTATGGTTNSDSVTFDPTVVGTILEATSSIGHFSLTIDNRTPIDLGSSAGAFEVADQLATDGTDDGVHSFYFQFEDVAGNSSAMQVDFTLDAVPPQLQAALVQDTAAGGLTNDDRVTSDPRLNGTVSDLTSGITTLQARVDSGAWIDVTHNAGQFAFDPNLALDGSDDGPHLVEFHAIDVAGNLRQTEFNFVLDTQAPGHTTQLSIDTAPGGGTNTDQITFEQLVTGTVIDASGGAVQLEYRVAAETWQSANVAADGSFTIDPGRQTNGLDDGLLPLEFSANDVAGNQSTWQYGFTFDTQSPISSASLARDTAPGGATNSDARTSDPTIAGNVADQTSGLASVQARLNGGNPTPVIPDASGDYVYQPGLSSDGDDDGTHQVTLTSDDVAGNRTTLQVDFTLDTVAPAIDAELEQDTAPDSTTNSDGQTSVATMAGTVVDTTTGLLAFTAAVDGGVATPVNVEPDGTFSFEPGFLATGADDGSHQIQFCGEDAVGNIQCQLTALTLDSQPPSLAAVLANDTAPEEGTNTDLLTSDPTVSGTTADATTSIAVLRATLDGGSPQDVPVTNGTFTYSPALALDGTDDGSHEVTLESQDSVGNRATTVINFILDTQSPTIDAALVNDTGRSTVDTITTDARWAGQVGADASAIASFRASVDGGTPVTVPLEPDGTFSFDPEFQRDGSDDGEHSVAFVVFDAAGNTRQLPLTMELDTVAPPAPAFDLAIATDSVPVGDQQTSFETVVLDGVSEAAVLAQLTSTGQSAVANASGQFSITDVILGIGRHDLTIEATDVAGNATRSDRTIIRTERDGDILLVEGDDLVFEYVLPVTLGQSQGTRTLKFELVPAFDRSEPSAVPDTFQVYLVDPANRSRTLLDRGLAGTSLLSISELPGASGIEFHPGAVVFDGDVVEIDVSTLTEPGIGHVVFQLINNDSDTASSMTIRQFENRLDPNGVSAPWFPELSPAAAPGPALNLATLTPSNQLSINANNLRLDTTTGRYVMDVSIENGGIGVDSRMALVIIGLPAGVTLANASGTDSGGNPYVNYLPTVSNGGIPAAARTDPVRLEFLSPQLTRFVVEPRFLVGGPNRPPSLDPVATISVFPGGYHEVTLVTTDPDGDAVTVELESPIDSNADIRLTGNRLTIAPSPADIGSFDLTIRASDGALQTSSTVRVDIPEDPIQTTRISGQVLDVNEDPLSGIPIALGDIETNTDAEGNFTLTVPDDVEDGSLEIHGEIVQGGIFPFVAEALALLLGRTLYSRSNNVLPRPIYLPRLDVQNYTQIDPAKTTVVETPVIPEASVTVGAGTLRDENGQLFNEKMGITEVPVARTPAALPADLLPDLVVTIQPGELNFSRPAPLSLPNRAGYPPGTQVDLWSINPATGMFDKVGIGIVSGDGESIDTTEGGIRNSSWHFFAPPPPAPRSPESNPLNESPGCAACKATVDAFGDVELHSGARLQEHTLVAYTSAGEERSLRLNYDSLRVDHRPILYLGYDGVPANSNLVMAATLVVERGGESFRVAGRKSVDVGLSDGEHFWSLPAEGGDIEAALQFSLVDRPSGVYRYELSTGLLQPGNQLNGSRSAQSGTIAHVDLGQSPFGAGWSLAGWSNLVENPDGSLLLVDGDGSELVFEPPAVADGPYGSPIGDFSILEQLVDESYRRTLTDQTRQLFDATGRLTDLIDRNGNRTVYAYTGNQLVSITDPVGLVTAISYNGNRVDKVTDPALRETTFEYDSDGRLIRINDPLGSRQFQYDARGLLTGETTRSGLTIVSDYDFAGRIRRVSSGDGTVHDFAPLQTRGVRRAFESQNLAAPPVAALALPPVAFHTDGNGNTVATTVDGKGQYVSARDGEGPRDQVIRNDDNLVSQTIDARGNRTSYFYDTAGNLTEIRHDTLQPGSTVDTAADLGTLIAKRVVSSFAGSFHTPNITQFELDEPATVWMQLDDLYEDLQLHLAQDANGNGTIETNEYLSSSVWGGVHPEQIFEPLPAGTYFAVVVPDSFPAGENSSFQLTIQPYAAPSGGAQHADAGNSPAQAMNIGTLTTGGLYRGTIGNADTDDYFRFTTSSAGTVRMELSGLTQGARLGIVADVDGDLVLDNREEIETSNYSADPDPEWLTEQLPPGTYYARVYRGRFDNMTPTAYHVEFRFDAQSETTPDPGNSLPLALNVGSLAAPRSFRQSVGALDKDDYYRIDLPAPAAVVARLTGLAEDIELGIVADVNGDGVHSSRDQIETSIQIDRSAEWVREELGAGTYYVRVYQDSYQEIENSLYELELSATPAIITTPSEPGNSPAQSLDLGILGDTRRFRDNVGPLDRDDYYQITLDQAASVIARIDGLNEDIELGIVADINGDGLLSAREQIETSMAFDNAREGVTEQLGPGTFFVRVYQDSFQESESSDYELTLSRTIVAPSVGTDPGDSLPAALDLGELDGPRVFNETVHALDINDYYRFTLATAATVTGHLFGLSEDLDFGLVADSNNNGLLDPREMVATSDTLYNEREWFEEDLPPGAYFVRVFQDSFQESEASHYQLELDVTTVPTSNSQDPGSSFATAASLGDLTGPLTINDVVGALDSIDYYRIDLTEYGRLTAHLSGLRESIELALVADANGNGQLDSRDQIAKSLTTVREREWLTEDLAPGTYFVQVFQAGFREYDESHYVLELDYETVVPSPEADPGNRPADALQLGDLPGAGFDLRQHVGTFDRDDYYEFSLTSETTVQFIASELRNNLTLGLVVDSDGDGELDNGEQFAMSDLNESIEWIQRTLAAGTYYVRVYQGSVRETENSHYRLELRVPETPSANPSDPGGNLNLAFDLGTYSDVISRSDNITRSSDNDDYYQLTLADPSELRVALSGVTADLDLRLIADANGNGNVDSGDVIEQSDLGGTENDFVREAVPAGTYFIHVFRETSPSTEQSPYNLEITASPLTITTPSDPGDTLATALNLGQLSATRTLRDAAGRLDDSDLYRFELPEPAEVRLRVDQLREDLDLSIITDVNANGVIDVNDDIIDMTNSAGTTHGLLTEQLPAGTYYIQVYSPINPGGQNSDYRLEAEALPLSITTSTDPGATLATALDIGLLGAEQTFRDVVGSLDVNDLYRFRLDDIRQVHVRMDELTEDLDLYLVADIDNDGVIDQGERIDLSNTGADLRDLMTEALVPGTYYIWAYSPTFPDGQNSGYRLTAESLPIPISTFDDPGATLADAMWLGEIPASRLIRDAVGNLDTRDLYRVDVSRATRINVQIDGLQEQLVVSILADTDGDGVIAANEIIDTVTTQLLGPGILSEDLPPGTYYVQVSIPSYPDGTNADYNLRIDSTPLDARLPDPGESLATARELGALGRAPKTISDVVGDFDLTDFYKFSLGQTSAVHLQLDGLTEDATISLIADLDDNGNVDNTDVIEQSTATGVNVDRLTEVLGPGEYAIRVSRSPTRGGQNTSYNLVLGAEPLRESGVRTFTYDPVFSRITSETDEVGRVTLYEVDPVNGNTLSQTQVVGRIDSPANGEQDDVVQQFTYGTDGQVDLQTDPLGRVTDYDYDSLGRLESVTYAKGTADEATTSYTHDSAGYVISETDENGNTTKLTRDAMNQPVRLASADPDGAGPLEPSVTTMMYDNSGNLISVTDPVGSVTTWTYDGQGHHTEMLTSAGSERYNYDRAGNPTVHTTPLDARTTYRYDARGRLADTHDPTGAVTQYTYDEDDHLTAVTDPRGNPTVYEYDSRGLLSSTNDATGKATHKRYNLAGNIVAETDRNDRQIRFAYDDLGREVSQTWLASDGALVNSLAFGFDAAGNLVSASDSSSSISYSYDNRNRIATADNSGSPSGPSVVLTYEYDGAENVTKLSESIDSVSAGEVQRTYDALNRVVQLTQSGTGVASKRIDISYTAADQIASLTRYSDLAGTVGVVDTSYTYDALGRLTVAHHTQSASTVSSYAGNYDASGRLIGMTDSLGEQLFVHNERDELLSVTRGQDDLEVYTYDAAGNRLTSISASYVVGNANRIQSDGLFQYSYDGEGNIILREEISTGQTWNMAYDHRGRVASVIHAESGGQEINRTDYVYDLLDRMILERSRQGASDVITHFAFDGAQTLLEFRDADGVGSGTPELWRRYLHGVDRVFAEESGTGDVLWSLDDVRRGTRDFVDSAGVVKNQVELGAFGNVINQTDESFSSRFLWQGLQHDTRLGGHWHNGTRLDSSIGRWWSPQASQQVAPPANQYVYKGNNPDGTAARVAAVPINHLAPGVRIENDAVYVGLFGEFELVSKLCQTTDEAADVTRRNECGTCDSGPEGIHKRAFD